MIIFEMCAQYIHPSIHPRTYTSGGSFYYCRLNYHRYDFAFFGNCALAHVRLLYSRYIACQSWTWQTFSPLLFHHHSVVFGFMCMWNAFQVPTVQFSLDYTIYTESQTNSSHPYLVSLPSSCLITIVDVVVVSSSLFFNQLLRLRYFYALNT